MSAQDKFKQDNQPAFLLHGYPFRETSLVTELFTQNFGRLAVVARGVRRPRSALRGVLQAFQPLLVGWSGKSELRTLHRAEWQGRTPLLQGRSLLCGFYLNELIMKLLPRDDPHEQLFAHYQHTLLVLAAQNDPATALRRFEIRLLKELGYALTLERDPHSSKPVQPELLYSYVIERGPVASNTEPGAMHILGKTLLDLANDDYSDPNTQQESKALMRLILSHYLGNQVLHTRQLLKDLQQL
ncbi:MAG TPA: DNA repair protein RecO [Burkholderiales bacterium]|nr:DNA repair protein RecO [Burkholderiales bacterium]